LIITVLVPRRRNSRRRFGQILGFIIRNSAGAQSERAADDEESVEGKIEHRVDVRGAGRRHLRPAIVVAEGRGGGAGTRLELGGERERSSASTTKTA